MIICETLIFGKTLFNYFFSYRYLPPYTSFLPTKDREEISEKGKEGQNRRKTLMESLMLSQLSYLAMFIILICITERHKMKEDPLNFNVLNITIEVIRWAFSPLSSLREMIHFLPRSFSYHLEFQNHHMGPTRPSNSNFENWEDRRRTERGCIERFHLNTKIVWWFIVHTGMLGSRLGIAANGKLNQIAPVRTRGMDSLGDGVRRENWSSSLLCSLEGLRNSAWKVEKPGRFPNGGLNHVIYMLLVMKTLTFVHNILCNIN